MKHKGEKHKKCSMVIVTVFLLGIMLVGTGCGKKTTNSNETAKQIAKQTETSKQDETKATITTEKVEAESVAVTVNDNGEVVDSAGNVIAESTENVITDENGNKSVMVVATANNDGTKSYNVVNKDTVTPNNDGTFTAEIKTESGNGSSTAAGAPTSAQIIAPTEAPTTVPTTASTTAPTAALTAAPTDEQTEESTQAPTEEPTSALFYNGKETPWVYSGNTRTKTMYDGKVITETKYTMEAETYTVYGQPYTLPAETIWGYFDRSAAQTMDDLINSNRVANGMSAYADSATLAYWADEGALRHARTNNGCPIYLEVGGMPHPNFDIFCIAGCFFDNADAPSMAMSCFVRDYNPDPDSKEGKYNYCVDINGQLVECYGEYSYSAAHYAVNFGTYYDGVTQ